MFNSDSGLITILLGQQFFLKIFGASEIIAKNQQQHIKKHKKTKHAPCVYSISGM